MQDEGEDDEDKEELDIEDMANKFCKLATTSKSARSTSAKKREREKKAQKVIMFKMHNILDRAPPSPTTSMRRWPRGWYSRARGRNNANKRVTKKEEKRKIQEAKEAAVRSRAGLKRDHWGRVIIAGAGRPGPLPYGRMVFDSTMASTLSPPTTTTNANVASSFQDVDMQ